MIIPTSANQPLMAIIPLAGGEQVDADSGVTKPEILGWDVVKSSAPVPALTVRHRKRATGVTRFVTLLLPGRLVSQHAPVCIPNGDEWTVETGTPRRRITVRLDDAVTLDPGAGSMPISVRRNDP
jgi:hypothetical protein